MRIFRSAFLFVFVWISSALSAPWLGISFKAEPFGKGIALNVQGIHPESGAAGKNIRAGDKIIGIGGKGISDMAELKAKLSGLPVGKSVSLNMERGEKKWTLTVPMTERPDDISNLMGGSSIGSKAVEFQKNFYRNGEKRKQKPKATLLDFWATWCGPCRQTLPILERLYQKLGKNGLEIIGVSSEQSEVLERFYREHPSPYPLYRDATEQMWRRYGISAVPTLMLLDENGYILKIWPGVPNEAALEKAVRETLE